MNFLLQNLTLYSLATSNLILSPFFSGPKSHLTITKFQICKSFSPIFYNALNVEMSKSTLSNFLSSAIKVENADSNEDDCTFQMTFQSTVNLGGMCNKQKIVINSSIFYDFKNDIAIYYDSNKNVNINIKLSSFVSITAIDCISISGSATVNLDSNCFLQIKHNNVLNLEVLPSQSYQIANTFFKEIDTYEDEAICDNFANSIIRARYGELQAKAINVTTSLSCTYLFDFDYLRSLSTFEVYSFDSIGVSGISTGDSIAPSPLNRFCIIYRREISCPGQSSQLFIAGFTQIVILDSYFDIKNQDGTIPNPYYSRQICSSSSESSSFVFIHCCSTLQFANYVSRVNVHIEAIDCFNYIPPTPSYNITMHTYCKDGSHPKISGQNSGKYKEEKEYLGLGSILAIIVIVLSLVFIFVLVIFFVFYFIIFRKPITTFEEDDNNDREHWNSRWKWILRHRTRQRTLNSRDIRIQPFEHSDEAIERRHKGLLTDADRLKSEHSVKDDDLLNYLKDEEAKKQQQSIADIDDPDLKRMGTTTDLTQERKIPDLRQAKSMIFHFSSSEGIHQMKKEERKRRPSDDNLFPLQTDPKVAQQLRQSTAAWKNLQDVGKDSSLGSVEYSDSSFMSKRRKANKNKALKPEINEDDISISWDSDDDTVTGAWSSDEIEEEEEESEN